MFRTLIGVCCLIYSVPNHKGCRNCFFALSSLCAPKSDTHTHTYMYTHMYTCNAKEARQSVVCPFGGQRALVPTVVERGPGPVVDGGDGLRGAAACLGTPRRLPTHRLLRIA